MSQANLQEPYEGGPIQRLTLHPPKTLYGYPKYPEMMVWKRWDSLETWPFLDIFGIYVRCLGCIDQNNDLRMSKDLSKNTEELDFRRQSDLSFLHQLKQIKTLNLKAHDSLHQGWKTTYTCQKKNTHTNTETETPTNYTLPSG